MRPAFLLVKSDSGKPTLLNVSQIEEMHAGDSLKKTIIYMIGDRDRGTYVVADATIAEIIETLFDSEGAIAVAGDVLSERNKPKADEST
jgi:hypothetical protein